MTATVRHDRLEGLPLALAASLLLLVASFWNWVAQWGGTLSNGNAFEAMQNGGSIWGSRLGWQFIAFGASQLAVHLGFGARVLGAGTHRARGLARLSREPAHLGRAVADARRPLGAGGQRRALPAFDLRRPPLSFRAGRVARHLACSTRAARSSARSSLLTLGCAARRALRGRGLAVAHRLDRGRRPGAARLQHGVRAVHAGRAAPRPPPRPRRATRT